VSTGLLEKIKKTKMISERYMQAAVSPPSGNAVKSAI
jgi:hypothetical protein